MIRPGPSRGRPLPSRSAAIAMHAASAAVWSLYPVWAAVFGFAAAVVVSGGTMLALSGMAQCVMAKTLWPDIQRDRAVWKAARVGVERRKTAAIGVVAVIIEDLCFLGALQFLNAVVAGALLQMYPVFYALWLSSTTGSRFHLSSRHLVGCLAAFVGAALVVLAQGSGSAELGGGWLPGVALIAGAITAIAVKSQEIALVDDISARLGWDTANRRHEMSVAVAISGVRNLAAGSLLLVFGIAVSTPAPTNTMIGALIFGAVLAPTAVALGRFAVLTSGDLGLMSIGSSKGLLTLTWAAALGALGTMNLAVLGAGVACISAGSAWALSTPSPSKQQHR